MKRKLHTEQEFAENNRLYSYKLSRLFLKDRKLFEEVCRIIPFSVGIHDRKTLNLVITNSVFSDLLETAPEDILNKGFSLIRKISDMTLLDQAIKIIQRYDQAEDYNSICSYFQRMRLNGEMTFTYAHKILIDHEKAFTIMYKLDELGLPGKFVKNLLGEVVADKDGWSRFQTLTKREKEILKLVATGCSTPEIAERLFVSDLTVKTHRRNIMQKIEAKNLAEMIRFAHAIEIIEEG